MYDIISLDVAHDFEQVRVVAQEFCNDLAPLDCITIIETLFNYIRCILGLRVCLDTATYVVEYFVFVYRISMFQNVLDCLVALLVF